MTILRWRCRACGCLGMDVPGLHSFWAHWNAVHTHHSIYGGTR